MFEIGSSSQRTFNSAARLAFRVIFRAAAQVRMDHLQPVPQRGAFILACNHISHFDPPLIGSMFPRHVDWMAMEELFRNARFAKWLERTGAFRVDRSGADRTALRTAARRLKAGRVVGIFPEGGIRAGETSILERAPMRPGVGALARISQAPVIPAVIVGSDRLYLRANWRPLRRPPVWILTGHPIAPPAPDDRDSPRNEFQTALANAFVELKEHLLSSCGVTVADLPKTPQARKGEDPYA